MTEHWEGPPWGDWVGLPPERTGPSVMPGRPGAAHARYTEPGYHSVFRTLPGHLRRLWHRIRGDRARP
jgi:hypothetical protein